jgi:serine/threonine protein kinase
VARVVDYLRILETEGGGELEKKLAPVLLLLVQDEKAAVDVTPWAGHDVDRARDITTLPVYSLAKSGDDKRVSVGRSRTADVTMNLERLSKIHAYLRPTSKGDLEITDAGSKNGTFVGHSRLEPGTPTRIKDGGTVHLGPYPFRYFTPKGFCAWLERMRGDEGPTVTGTSQARLEIIGSLGKGGMADVALAKRVGPGGFSKEVALKRLLPEMAHDKNFVEMFLQEAKIAARISHPNVVQIYDLGWDGQRYFIAMEYVPGWNMSTIQKAARRTGQHIPIAVACRIALDLCAGLKAAHSSVDDAGKPLRIIHRDVSPQNVLVSVDGVAKLSDFGVSRAADSARRTKTGELKGKLGYMAPEQLQESYGPIDHRTDIFAASTTIFESFTAAPLFRRANDVDTMHALLHDPIPELRYLRPDVPRKVSDGLARGLVRETAQRTSEIGELHELFTDVCLELGVGGPGVVATWLQGLRDAQALPHVRTRSVGNSPTERIQRESKKT